MSDQPTSSESKVKRFIGSFGILLVFGFLALIFVQGVQTESLEEEAYKGEFDEATIAQRWANFEENAKAQSELVDEAKLADAMKTVAKSTAAEAKTDVVVPGSPTFLKQMEAASAPASAEKAEEEQPADAEAPAAEEKAASQDAKKPKAAKPKAEKASAGKAAKTDSASADAGAEKEKRKAPAPEEK